MMLEQREGGCHCGRVRFRARVDLDLLSQCNCSICTKKGILHLPIAPEDFELLRGKTALTVYTFETGVAQHSFCSHCGMHAFYTRAHNRTGSPSMRAVSTTSMGPAYSRRGFSEDGIGKRRSGSALRQAAMWRLPG